MINTLLSQIKDSDPDKKPTSSTGFDVLRPRIKDNQYSFDRKIDGAIKCRNLTIMTTFFVTSYYKGKPFTDYAKNGNDVLLLFWQYRQVEDFEIKDIDQSWRI